MLVNSYVVPPSLEAVARSEQQQCSSEVGWNNWIRRIAGVKKLERRRLNDLKGGSALDLAIYYCFQSQ